MKFVADRAVYCPSPVRQEPPSQKVSYPYCYCHNCQNPRGPLSLKYVVLILGWNIPQSSWTFLADFWGVTASCRSLLAGDVPEGRLGKRPTGMRRGAIIWRITRKHTIFGISNNCFCVIFSGELFLCSTFSCFSNNENVSLSMILLSKSQGVCIFVFMFLSTNPVKTQISYPNHP